MVGGDHRKSRSYRSACTRTHFSWFRFGTSKKSGTQKAWYLHSLPQGQKYRSLQANQDDKGSLQNAKWRRSRTSGRNFWWFDNSRSQSPEWGKWVSRHWSTRCRGTRFSHSMESIVPVQKTKTSQETQRRLQKFLELDRKPKVTMRPRRHGICRKVSLSSKQRARPRSTRLPKHG